MLNIETEVEMKLDTIDKLDRQEIWENQQEQGNESRDELSIVEVKCAIKEMKNRKASDDDELRIEIFKAAGIECIYWLKSIINNEWRQKKVPNDWQKATVCLIYKTGKRSNCANYRGISLLSHV